MSIRSASTVERRCTMCVTHIAATVPPSPTTSPTTAVPPSPMTSPAALPGGRLVFARLVGDVEVGLFTINPDGSDTKPLWPMIRRRGAVATWSRINEGGEGIDAATRQALAGVPGPPEGKDGSA